MTSGAGLASRRPGGRPEARHSSVDDLVLPAILTPPEIPAAAVERDRLLSILEVALRQRLTIVVAPPGYGKTVLLSQWARSRSRERVRWLTLSAEHNDPDRLARALWEALEPPGHA